MSQNPHHRGVADGAYGIISGSDDAAYCTFELLERTKLLDGLKKLFPVPPLPFPFNPQVFFKQSPAVPD